MTIQNDQMIFADKEEVLCICKNQPFAYGNVMKLGTKYVVKLQQDYIKQSSLIWDYVVPYDIHLKEYLEECKLEEQYQIIKEHFHGIITNKGRKL